MEPTRINPDGNVSAISDGRPGQRGNRDFTYDGLDRLKTAQPIMFGNTGTVATASYAYDVLENLTRRKTGQVNFQGSFRRQLYRAKFGIEFLHSREICSCKTCLDDCAQPLVKNLGE